MVLSLIPFTLKVEIVAECVFTAFVCCCKNDAHVEFSPSLLVDAEGRLLERYTPISTLKLFLKVFLAHSLCLFLSKEGCRL